MSFDAVTLCVASQRMFILGKCIFRYDSIRELLDTPSYNVKIKSDEIQQ
jgi:hypothetical protein